ncbi:MAG: hypothetical protein ABIW76_02260 [Fibrobacteria bacterium]
MTFLKRGSNSISITPLHLLIAALGFLVSAPVHSDTLVDTVLARYGYDAFKKAEEIRFTFRGTLAGIGPSHTWIWKMQRDSVYSIEDGVSIGYSRKAMGDKEMKLDKSFVNDMYWLTFPLHLAMDKGIQVVVDSQASVSPVKKEPLRRIKVTYMQAQGYTPNDSYELFAAPDGLIKEWKYYKGGGKLGASFTWEKYAEIGGILFSQEHKGLAHITFSGIEVK